jgi:PPOX class probable F420-dependent enzyme
MPTFTAVRLETLPEWALRLVRDARVARLAYLDADDRPRVLPVTFAVAGEAAWTAIDEKPKKTTEPARVAYLRRRPEAALVIDEYDDDWTRLAWVQLLGRVDVVPIGDSGPDAIDHSAPEAIAALAAKYPQYAERTPPGPLLRLTVERALHWRAAG